MHVLGTSARPDLPLAVIVGAGALGMAMARRTALTHRVLLADIDGAVAEERAARMRDEGCDASAIACDVTSAADVARLAAGVAERGGLGALIYVAGLTPSMADFASVIRVNLMGAAMICEALLPLTRQGSSAVLISSLASQYKPPAEAIAELRTSAAPDIAERLAAVLGDNATSPMAYTYSKWGLNFYARRHAAEWGARGARIVSLSPGLIATPMGAIAFENSPGKRAMYAKSPLARECTMLEIADVAEFLTSPRASFISGTDILVDGGLAAALSDD